MLSAGVISINPSCQQNHGNILSSIVRPRIKHAINLDTGRIFIPSCILLSSLPKKERDYDKIRNSRDSMKTTGTPGIIVFTFFLTYF